MGRSGTTVVTELLGASGVFLDEVNWAHEHDEARLVNDTYLEENYGARRGRPYGHLPADEIVVSDPTWHERAEHFIATMDSRANGHQVWAFKDPRTTILHDLWLRHMDVVVGVFRRPDEVVESYVRQGWIDGWRKRRTTLRYWERFNQSLIHILDRPGDYERHLVETSSDLVPQLEHVTARLGVELREQEAGIFDPARQSPPAATGVGKGEALYRELVARRSVAP